LTDDIGERKGGEGLGKKKKEGGCKGKERH